ncbi:MAG: ABC transporter ATP-binding protein [Spirochaetia bacterium]
MSRIELQALTVLSPHGRTLLDSVDFSLSAGEFCLIAGRNGAGKTLLARCMAGLVSPHSGTVTTEGAPARLVFQDTRSQVLGQTVEEDVALGPESAGLSRAAVDDRVGEALAQTGLEAMRRRDPFTLSGGEQRRLSIASLLALRPDILILDEPFSSLDFDGVRSVLSLLVALHAAGHGLAVITHDIEKLAAHATRLVLLDRGRIVEDAAPEIAVEAAAQCGLKPPRGPVGDMTWLH